MAELVVLAVLIGLVVAIAYPMLAARTRRRDPRSQDDVTGTEPFPPRRPDDPIPGSRTRRKRHGRS